MTPEHAVVRERVAECMKRGLTNKEIASELGLSVPAVNNRTRRFPELQSVRRGLHHARARLRLTQEQLAARESVATYLTRGLTDKEISRELGFTERMVKNHIQRLFTTYGTRRRIVLALMLVGAAPYEITH